MPVLRVLVPPSPSTCLCDTGDSYKGNLEPGEPGEKATDKNMRNLLILVNKLQQNFCGMTLLPDGHAEGMMN